MNAQSCNLYEYTRYEYTNIINVGVVSVFDAFVVVDAVTPLFKYNDVGFDGNDVVDAGSLFGFGNNAGDIANSFINS